MLTLDTLLTRSYVKHYDQIFWFKDVSLKGTVLIVPDETHRSFIGNCWLPVFRQHIPSLEILVETQPKREKAIAQRQGKPSIYNKRGRDYLAQQQRLGGTE